MQTYRLFEGVWDSWPWLYSISDKTGQEKRREEKKGMEERRREWKTGQEKGMEEDEGREEEGHGSDLQNK
jgi:hypothetical protein